MRPICHLQPITSNELAEPNGFARDDKSQTSRQWHQSANRRRLPVIVVFHSRQAGGASQSGDRQQEENRREDQRSYQNETRVVNNYDGGGQEEAQPQSESSHGAFVTANNTRSKWPSPQSRNSQPSKANSLLHLELARRTKSIVITFNYRIGLLGYLPYVDLEDQQLGSGGGHTRSNHALWDQIGLLHWIKHNVAHFGGDQTNVSLLSGDSGACQMLQLLALSPQARGLFKRLVLVHDDGPPGMSVSNPNEHFGRLFGLAHQAKHLHRKLVSELGLILERNHLLEEETSSSSENTNNDHAQDNLEIDQRVSNFLKSAKLEHLARAEHELAKVSVAHNPSGHHSGHRNKHHHQTHADTGYRQEPPRPSGQSLASTRLLDVMQEANLDDKLLFPYFAHLIKTNQSLAFAETYEVISPTKGEGQASGQDGFWSALAASLDEQQAQDNSTVPLQTIQLESDYCRYVQQLYGQMFARGPDLAELDEGQLMNGLKRADPYKLIPRVIDHHQPMMMAPAPTNGQVVNKATASGASGANEKEAKSDQSASKHFVKWRQRNRTANALEFYHLRHAHLLQQLLVQGIEQVRLSANNNNLSTSGDRNSSLQEHLVDSSNLDEEEGDDDEDEGHLVTRLQRQQQRSIMLMQHQQSGHESAGFSRNRRDSTDGQAAALSQQLVELLGSFDLLVAFRGEPLASGASSSAAGSFVGPEELSLIRLAFHNKTLSEPLVSYLQLADLHQLALIKSDPKHLSNLCEFTPSRPQTTNQSSSSLTTNWWREPKLEGPRSSFVLVTSRRRRRPRRPPMVNGPDVDGTNKEPSVLNNDDELLLDRIGQFASTGRLSWRAVKDLGDTHGEPRAYELTARPYDTLNRRLGWPLDSANISSSHALVQDLLSVRLNLVPYLRRLLEVANSRRPNSPVKQNHEQLLEHPLMPRVDLISCLSELSSILDQQQATSQEGGSAKNLLFDNSTLVRFHEESPCLLNATNKLRLQLRAGAAEELEPLIRQYFVINEQRQKKQRQMATKTNDQLLGQLTNKSNQDVILSDQLQQKQAAGQRVSSMTTRNLVNQSEGLYLDQLSSSSSSGGVADQMVGHHLERQSATDGRLSLNGDHQRLDLSGHSGSESQQATSSPTSSSSGGGIRSFFAKTYKDAVGQALGIVVGTGLLIFLLNLAIVLVIAIRSRRNLRRSAGAGSHSRQSVQDSSSASATIDMDASQGQLKSSLESAEPIGCQHFFNLSTQQSNGLIDLRRPQLGSDQASHLISSFKNLDEQQQQQPIQTRSSLSSSNSHRANKSIKFDLSGASADKSLTRVAPGQGQRGIMKQPVTTSDEDELQLTETPVGQACAHHNHQQHQQQQQLYHHQLNHQHRNQSEQETDLYAQMAISPVSLDVLDLIPLDGISCYDAHELAELTSSGDDYRTRASGNQKLVAPPTVARACQHHLRLQQQQQQQHNLHKQSLGSSSLTSPFASQSTHSTISASNNGHTQNLNTLNGPPEFSPRRNRTQQQQQLTFYAGLGMGAMNSPTSSASMSSAPTPILLTHSHYGIQNPVMITKDQNQSGSLSGPFDQEDPMRAGNHQVISLIYGGDSLATMGQASTLNAVQLEGGNLAMLSNRDQVMLEPQEQWQHLAN